MLASMVVGSDVTDSGVVVDVDAQAENNMEIIINK
jgi:hypothetical protein